MNFYKPEEDSFLLAKVIQRYIKLLNKKKIKVLRILDLGTGSGIQAKNCITCGIKPSQILSVDINTNALREAKKLKVETKKSDLFEKIDKKFNLIIFNPPYLPKHKFDSKSDTTGGKKGDETIIKFIKQLKKHLEKKGNSFLLTSSHTPKKRWTKEAKKQKLKIIKVETKKLFYEELYVWDIKRKE